MSEDQSQFRFDSLKQTWVIIATGRSARPDEFILPEEVQTEQDCPFCLGNEHETPHEIYAVRSDGSNSDSTGWEIRVVPNLYPALTVQPDELGRTAEGMYDRMHGIGAHEVIIESPDHDIDLTDCSKDHLREVLTTYRMRMSDLMKDRRMRYVLIFKNQGGTAGATLSHPHSQIIATPITPRAVKTELNACLDHFQRKERCLICDIIKQESACGDRIIYDDGAFIAFTPYASRFPFELFIAPCNHSHNFAEIPDQDLDNLAYCMRNVQKRMKALLDDPAYNLMIHSSPNLNSFSPHPTNWTNIEHSYHWHIELFPRITRIAGFELGTDFHINSTAPEEAARLLREVRLSE